MENKEQMNELREEISKILIDHGLRSDTLLLEQLLSLVDKPKVGVRQVKKPVYPEGLVHPHFEVVIEEVTQTPNLEEVKRKFAERFVASDVFNGFEWSDRNKEIFNFFTPLLATKEHDEALLREFVKWEQSRWAIIDTKELNKDIVDFIKDKNLEDDGKTDGPHPDVHWELNYKGEPIK